jgi:hypothetical protein
MVTIGLGFSLVHMAPPVAGFSFLALYALVFLVCRFCTGCLPVVYRFLVIFFLDSQKKTPAG